MARENAYRRVWYLLIVIAISFTGKGNCQDYSPEQLARLVGEKFVKNPDAFLQWHYGGAVVFDGLFSANQTLGIDFQSVIDKSLDHFMDNPLSYAYKILHNIKIPADSRVGDDIGLFPIVYLERYTISKEYNDYRVITTVIDDYIVKFPLRLPDSTFSRHSGWKGEQDRNASFVWADDQYMGLTLTARWARYHRDQTLATFVAKQQDLFNHHLQDLKDSLFFHGYNDADQHTSCCKWGRANGWSIMASIEVLKALKQFPALSAMYQKLLPPFVAQCRAMLKYQSDDGRWRQVINEPTTFLETSATAMILRSLTIGVTEGWLSRHEFSSAIMKAWKGLSKTVNHDGTVSGVCSGTGIMTSVDDYEKRPTGYFQSADGGVGSVLLAAVEYHNFLKFINN